MDNVRQCERDYDRETGRSREDGCREPATEAAVVYGGQHFFCATHAPEARRLSGMIWRIAQGDPEARRLRDWINQSPTREEYDRRVATLPLDGGA